MKRSNIFVKKIKRALILTIIVVIAAVLFLAGCGTGSSSESTGLSAATSNTTSTVSTAATATGQKAFTLDELKTYNGQNGNAAYIAINGVVYDVTNEIKWRNGMHQGFQAGQNLTDAIANSPHGTSKLEGIPVVGTLVK